MQSTIIQKINVDLYFIFVIMANSAILADVAELVDALDLGSSVFGVRVRVSSSALNFAVFIATITKKLV